MYIDLHLHSTASDGTDAPAALPALLRAHNVTTFSLTDHDTVDGLAHLEKADLTGLRFIPGIEFSCITESGKCHILGYGFERTHPAFLAALDAGREKRREKLRLRLNYLKTHFGLALTDAETAWLRAIPSPGKPHLAKLLVDRGLAPDIATAIKAHIDPCPTGSDRIGADLAVSAILASGGTPVWAHPLGGEGERPLTGEQFSAQLQTLLSCGIRGLECYYSRYEDAQIRFLLETAQAHSLLITGGSDYHGTAKSGITPGKLSSTGLRLPPSHFPL